eukprot:GDKI01001367.1.p1 GENE.GDKI01001367.1~~GDKI01001367.1.p1  ORF type:complete len:362 (-),score=78.56 GDKI01001367.1:59-1144(-)
MAFSLTSQLTTQSCRLAAHRVIFKESSAWHPTHAAATCPNVFHRRQSARGFPGSPVLGGQIPSPRPITNMRATPVIRATGGSGGGSANINKKLSRASGGFGSTISEFFADLPQEAAEKGITGVVSEKMQESKEQRQKRREKAAFVFMRDTVMSYEGMFTYKHYMDYMRKLLEYLGVTGVRSKLPGASKGPAVEKLKKELAVLEAMLPAELELDDAALLLPEKRKLLAEAAGTSVSLVERVLLQHETLKTDRSWYMRRIMLGLRLPESFLERQQLSAIDRPLMREAKLEYEQMKKGATHKQLYGRPNKNWWIYRHPSQGFDRWKDGITHVKKYPGSWLEKQRKTIPKHMRLSEKSIAKWAKT